MSKIKEDSSPIKSRQKILNVIYFRDVNKTHSLKLSIRKLNFLLFSIVLILVWLGVSNWLLFGLFQENHKYQEKLSQTLNIIFGYEIKYDGVYESAYPENLIFDEVHKEVPLVKEAAPIPQQQLEHATKEAVAQLKTEETTVAKEAEESVPLLSKHSSSKDAWPILVENSFLYFNPPQLNLRFSIHNTKSPARYEGYIWAVVAVKKDSEGSIYFGSSKKLQLSKDGEAINPKLSANKYNIRYYSTKTFSFEIPSNLQGEVEKVFIYMMNKEGHKEVSEIQVHKELKTLALVRANDHEPLSKQGENDETVYKKDVDKIR